MAAQSSVRISTGQIAFAGGVNSNVVPTLASPLNPDGLKPNQLAWLTNGVVRGGGIMPRPGYVYIGKIKQDGTYQESQIYRPDVGLPYIMSQISGHTYTVRVDEGMPLPVHDVSVVGDPNQNDTVLNWMTQAEQFMIINDGIRLPLFWDGTSLRRSLGPSISYGILAVAFNAPAVGAIIPITLTDPYSGPVGQIFYIGGKRYQQVNPNSVATINNSWASAAGTIRPTPGTVIPANTDFFKHLAAPPTARTFTTLVDYTTPAYGASIDVPVQIDPTFGGTITGLNYFTSPNPAVQYVQNVTAIGYAPLGPNQIYVVNLDDVPATVHAIGTPLESLAELPVGTAMDYYMGRVWVAGSPERGNGREYLAGDIVGSPATPTSGTPQYGYRDSILHITENSYLSLGGTFLVPTQAGNIIALSHSINLDTALGEGQLMPFTRKTIYSVNVVPQRAAWALLSEPIQRVAQVNFGTTGHRSVVPVNGDLFYQSLDGVRSFFQAIRYFQQWGNVPASSEQNRVVSQNDPDLLLHGSGVEFDNRLLQTCLPEQGVRGVIHKAIMPLDFNLLSSLSETSPPAWQGAWQGLNFLQLLSADFGGTPRCFSTAQSKLDASIELWEITKDDKFDTNQEGEVRIKWGFETACFDWGKPFVLKELETMEFWIDRVFGTVDFTLEFRPGQSSCWTLWNQWQVCAPKDACEIPDTSVDCTYAQQPYSEQYRSMYAMPKPPTICNTNMNMNRPVNQDYSFQFRLTVKGFCRVRGFVIHALERSKGPFEDITC